MTGMVQILGRVGLVALLAAALVPACKHDHAAGEKGHQHDPGDRAAAPGAADEEVEPIAITRWTEKNELFVEFPPPLAGEPVKYHAHVTHLDGFEAATAGRFAVRFRSGTAVAAEAQIDGVKRAGIFTPEGVAPPAGKYTLEMSYEHEGKADVFDCGEIEVTKALPPKEEEAPSTAITFLKESQWKIPFATVWAEERPMAREIELPATVEPAGSDQLTLGAPIAGRFFHNPKLALAEGLRIKKGDVVGSIAPTVAGDDYNRLQLAVDESRLEKEQTAREIARVEPLVKQGLLPERRLTDLRNELETLDARFRSAQSRIGRVQAPGGTGGLPIKAGQEGAIGQVLVPNGEPVEAGAPLLRLSGTGHLWLRARFVARPAASFGRATPTGIRLASGERVDLTEQGARFLSAAPVVDAASRIATWLVDLAPARDRPLPDDVRAGASVVLAVRLGEPKPMLAVPRSAVVEINTQLFVFVQVDGEHFEKRRVVVGDADGAFIPVLSGLAARERVVSVGGFDVHLAALMGTTESHRH